MVDYIEIRGAVPDTVEERLAESMSPWPVLGVLVEPRGDGIIDVGVWIEAGDDGLEEEVRITLRSLGCEEVGRFVHKGEDWSAEWRANLTAFEVGRRWWIDPHPHRVVDVPGGRLRLAVEPRAAFGSGTHESTQLVLTELEEIDCGGLAILDIGTGSGVLAVAADRLGAESVVALDNDPIAAWEARTTAQRQSWVCHPLVVAGSVQCLGDAVFDLVLCNMILTEFGPLLDEIDRVVSPTGQVILSGILECEESAVEVMLGDRGMTVIGDRELRGWISLRAARKESV